MADNRGFDVFLAADTIAAFDRTFDGTFDGNRFDAETRHRTALVRLEGEFGAVVCSSDVLKRSVSTPSG